MTEQPSDECTTSDAARLLNIGDTMLRRLCSQGFIARHRRGFTTVSGAVQGYAGYLRQASERSDQHASQSRAHHAKAQKIIRATARRRASLVERTTVETVIDQTIDIAVARLNAVDLVGLVPGDVVRVFQAETKAACARIGEARDRAVADLRGDDLEDDDGR